MLEHGWLHGVTTLKVQKVANNKIKVQKVCSVTAWFDTQHHFISSSFLFLFKFSGDSLFAKLSTSLLHSILDGLS